MKTKKKQKKMVLWVVEIYENGTWERFRTCDTKKIAQKSLLDCAYAFDGAERKFRLAKYERVKP